jgi:uncharacterized protein YfeS
MSKSDSSGESRRSRTIRFAIVGIFLCIMAYGLYGTWDRLTYAYRKQRILYDRSAVRAESLKTIRDVSKPDYMKAEALLHLAVYDESDAFAFARQWVKLDDPVLVRAGIKTLKLSREASDEQLLLDMYSRIGTDLNLKVYRDDIVDSLVAKPMALESLYKIGQMKWTTKLGQIKIYGAIAQKETDKAQKAKIFNHLKALAETSKGDVHVQAVLAMSAAAPNDPEVLQLLRQAGESGDPDLVDYALMHLAKLKDSWLLKNYKSLLNSHDPHVESAALRTIGYFCPEKIGPELEKLFFATDDMQLRTQIVGASVLYDDESSREFVKKALADNKLGALEHQILLNKISQAKAENQKGCKLPAP